MSDAKLNIDIGRGDLKMHETNMRFQRHIERYRHIRKWCHGRVVDIGCGVGYGSYLISQNPDVDEVFGIEPVKTSYNTAIVEYFDQKIVFFNEKFGKTIFKANVAVLIEVLEHIKNPGSIIQTCKNFGIDRIIATVPSYKTTHFNPHHINDFTEEDFRYLMSQNGYAVRNFTDRSYPYPYDANSHGIRIFNEEVFLGVFQLENENE